MPLSHPQHPVAVPLIEWRNGARSFSFFLSFFHRTGRDVHHRLTAHQPAPTRREKIIATALSACPPARLPALLLGIGLQLQVLPCWALSGVGAREYVSRDEESSDQAVGRQGKQRDERKGEGAAGHPAGGRSVGTSVLVVRGLADRTLVDAGPVYPARSAQRGCSGGLASVCVDRYVVCVRWSLRVGEGPGRVRASVAALVVPGDGGAAERRYAVYIHSVVPASSPAPNSYKALCTAPPPKSVPSPSLRRPNTQFGPISILSVSTTRKKPLFSSFYRYSRCESGYPEVAKTFSTLLNSYVAPFVVSGTPPRMLTRSPPQRSPPPQR